MITLAAQRWRQILAFDDRSEERQGASTSRNLLVELGKLSSTILEFTRDAAGLGRAKANDFLFFPR